MKVLLVDDDVDLLDVTAYALRREGFQLMTAADGEMAIARWERFRPDIVVLDVDLPGRSGFEVCRAIRRAGATPVILVTALRNDDDVERGFRAGADDYVVKPFSLRQLALRIRAVAGRYAATATVDEIAEVREGDLVLDREAHQARVGDRTVQLTPIEFRLLYLLVSNSGRVVSLARLVEYAWDYEDGDPSLLKTHICHIRKKLRLGPDGPGVIVSVPRVGYRFARATDPCDDGANRGRRSRPAASFSTLSQQAVN
jgi:DNA-binding response OmpR family regulator